MRTMTWTRMSLLLAAASVFMPGPGALAAADSQAKVGMEARGVSPWHVLNDRWGLDVRDASNRPVSARQLEKELKLAAAGAAAENAYASKLPRASAAILMLELLSAVEASLRPWLPRRSVAAASAAGVPKSPRLAAALLALAFIPIVSAVLRASCPENLAVPSRIPSPLRC